MIIKKITTMARAALSKISQKKWLAGSKKAAGLQRAGKNTNHSDHKLDGGIGVVFFGSQVRL
ncbi:hypothetical protein H0A66_04810 [Alcaligenaceae bacterium]|nr:hypothetical protein [Alcaligenaceae bacterium]